MRRLLSLIAWLVSPTLAGGLDRPPPLDLVWEDLTKVRIEWKTTWDETYKANISRWNEELDRVARDRNEHARLLRTRAIHLLRRLIERFPGDRARVLAATSEIAGNLHSLGMPSRANFALKGLLDRSCGEPDLAAQLLARILQGARWEEPWSVQRGREWVEFAARRLLALADAGALPDDHPYVVVALRALVILRRLQGRFLDASELLDRLARLRGSNEWLLTQRAELLFAADHDHEALPIFRDLASHSERNYLARDRAKTIAELPSQAPPAFPSGGLLEMKWEAVKSGLPPAMIGRLVEIFEAPESATTVVSWGRERFRSLWAEADSFVRSRRDEEMANLRREQEAKAEALARSPGWGALGRAVALHRRYPFAHSAHERLLRLGERWLREGKMGLALACFRDILARCRHRRTLEAAEGGIEIIKAAKTEPRPAESPNLDLRQIRTLALPYDPWHQEVLARFVPNQIEAMVWPDATRLVSCGDGLLVAGPELLALYRKDSDKPTWLHRPSLPTTWHRKMHVSDYRHILLPSPLEPAVDDGVIFTRWGMDPTRRYMTGLAAFDARTGRMLWSTVGSREWEGLRPVSEPAFAEGRLYVLAVRRGRGAALPVSPVILVCLEPASGRLLWTRTLASQRVSLLVSDRSDLRGWRFDPVHYGNAVTVDAGQVFCSTNMGFVACCDARDGLVVWARQYPRVQIRWNAASVARRHGSRPIVAGRAVVFAPRDRVAVFALDRRDGSLFWENLFAPSQEVVGTWREALVVRDERRLAAISLEDGRCLWRRYFADGLDACSRPCGDSVVVAASGKLLDVSLDDGHTLRSAEFRQPVRDVARLGNRLVVLTRNAVAPGPGPRRVMVASPKRSLDLPLTTCWEMSRPNPVLIVPPPEAGLPGRVLVLSRGVLECLEAGPRPRVLWRSLPRPGWRATTWAKGRLVLVYSRMVAAISLDDGRVLWEQAVPFPLRRWQIAGESLIVAAFNGEEHTRRAAAIDLATGRLLWHRRFEGLGSEWGNYFLGIAWDGRRAHLPASLEIYGDRIFDFALEPRTGVIKAVEPLLPKDLRWPRESRVEGDWGVLVPPDRVPIGIVFGPTPKLVKRKGPLDGYRPEREIAKWLEVRGNWAVVHQDEGYPQNRHTLWVLRRGDPAYVLKRPGGGSIRGDYLFQREESALRVVHLPSRKEILCRIPLTETGMARVLDYRLEGDRLVVVSGLERGPYRSRYVPYRVRVDVFALATGDHLRGQLLADLPYWRFLTRLEWRDVPLFHAQVAWGEGVVLVTWAGGIRALAPAAPRGRERPRERTVAYRQEGDCRCDGRLDDWDPRSATALPTRRGRGRLFVAHDRERLRVALEVPAGGASARLGRGAHGAGDFLELALTTTEGTFHWLVAADPTHECRWEELGSKVPEEAEAAAAHDPLSGRLTWELALPLGELVDRRSGDEWRSMGMSLALHSGDEVVAKWGSGLACGLVVPELHEPLYLHPLSRAGEEASLAIAHAVPELPLAWHFFMRWCRARGRNRAAAAARLADYLRRHPRGYAAERALVELDNLFRTDARTDPSEKVIAMARKAGVDARLVELYRCWAGVYLSQWVHIDPKQPPETIVLLFNSLSEDKEPTCGAYWGESPKRVGGASGPLARRPAGPLPATGGWHQLRVPLLWLRLHETPIHNLTFAQVGGAAVVWDKTAVVVGGREKVILDEPRDDAETSEDWRWVSSPRKSGARAHTHPRPGGRGFQRHSIEFSVPVLAHVARRTAGPFLSQWVYLDPQEPPGAIRLVLSSRSSEGRFTLMWGKALRRARYMGPLPKPGGWRQLLVPLAWTPFAGRPIHGISFGHDGGRLWWDRTAIVKDGRETVIIEDETPTGSSGGDKWLWVSEPVKSGKLSHTDREKGRQTSHGCAYLAQPITQHFLGDARRAESALRVNIPRLGPTDDAWHAFTSLLDLRHRTTKERLELFHWFLKSLPDHPNALDVLKAMVAAYRSLDDPQPEASAEKVMVRCGLPEEVRYAFRRRFLSGPNTFVLAWRVLGPFPNPDGKGHAAVYPPETESVDLAKTYEVVGGKARWRFHKATAREVDLARLFEPREHVVAYAVCWVYSESELPAVVELGSDDGCKLWVNRKLVLDRPELRSAAPGQDRVPVVLRKGWNEFLLKVDQAGSEWQFFFELVDREGRGLLDRLTLSTVPPPKPNR